MTFPSSNPYHCQEAADGRGYEFFPAAGGRCRLVLSSGAADFKRYSFAAHALVFSIWVDEPAVKHRADPRIAATIFWFIEQLFQLDAATVLLWGCSTQDDAEVARHRMFGRWYERWKAHSRAPAVLKKDFHPQPREYISFLYRADNPARIEIESIPVGQWDEK